MDNIKYRVRIGERGKIVEIELEKGSSVKEVLNAARSKLPQIPLKLGTINKIKHSLAGEVTLKNLAPYEGVLTVYL